jgi:hypothetical protein
VDFSLAQRPSETIEFARIGGDERSVATRQNGIRRDSLGIAEAAQL